MGQLEFTRRNSIRDHIVIIGGNAGARLASKNFDQLVYFLESYINFETHPEYGKYPFRKLKGSIDDNIDFLKQDDVDYFVATGDNKMREEITHKLIEATNKKPVNCIHPTAKLEGKKVGWGNLICANAFVNIDAKIRNGTIINTNAIIEHDCIIDDFAQISPATTLAGRVEVGKKAFVATNSTVIPGIKIGSGSYVAAGSVVTKDVKDNVLVAGCPAIFKKRL